MNHAEKSAPVIKSTAVREHERSHDSEFFCWGVQVLTADVEGL